MSTDDEIAKALVARMEREMMEALFGNSTNNVGPPTTLDVNKFTEDCERVLRNMRRTQIIFVVDESHLGPPIMYETPNDGTRVELSWLQARELHKSWPLGIVKILDEHSAEFVPVSSFMQALIPVGELPGPLYDVAEDVQDDGSR
jgi:hypothetical protein